MDADTRAQLDEVFEDAGAPVIGCDDLAAVTGWDVGDVRDVAREMDAPVVGRSIVITRTMATAIIETLEDEADDDDDDDYDATDDDDGDD